MSNQSRNRFQYIDALRGFAILGVILAHAASITQTQGLLRTVANTAGMGVQLFFVISAFTIFHMLAKHAVQEKRPLRNFFIRRLFRIVPVYWFGILFYTAMFGLDSRGWLPGPELWHYPLHITLTNLLHPLTQSSVVPGGWSISCEVLFYLSVPIWFKWIRNISHAYIFAIVSVLILPIVTKILAKIAAPYFATIDPVLIKLYWERFPLMSLGSFSFGILLYYLLKKENHLRFFYSKKINAVTVGSICLLMASCMMLYPRLPVQSHLYCVLFMMLALMLSIHPWKVFVNPLTIFMGRISYSAYLIHFFVLKSLTVSLGQMAPGIVSQPMFYFGVVLVLGVGLTVPLAFCGYQWIEQPAINMSKQWIHNREKKEKELETGENVVNQSFPRAVERDRVGA